MNAQNTSARYNWRGDVVFDNHDNGSPSSVSLSGSDNVPFGSIRSMDFTLGFDASSSASALQLEASADADVSAALVGSPLTIAGSYIGPIRAIVSASAATSGSHTVEGPWEAGTRVFLPVTFSLDGSAFATLANNDGTGPFLSSTAGVTALANFGGYIGSPVPSNANLSFRNSDDNNEGQLFEEFLFEVEIGDDLTYSMSLITSVIEDTAFEAGGPTSVTNSGMASGVAQLVFGDPYVEPTEFIWNEPAGGLFSDGDNWESGVGPSSNDTALFNLPGAYEVTLSEDAQVGNLRVTAGHPEINASSFRLTGGTLEVGDGNSPAALTLTADSGIVAAATAAADAASTVDQTPDTTDEPFTHSYDMVYVLPLGEVKIVGGDQFERVQAKVSAVIEGRLDIETGGEFGTPLLIVGDNDREGVVTLSSGSSASNQTAALKATRMVLGDDQDFGFEDGGKGTLNVGLNSRAEVGDLVVGDGGEGIVNVSMGGKLIVSGNAILGDNLGSSGMVRVAGEGSRVEFRGTSESPTGNLRIGFLGSGELVVREDAEVLIGDEGRVGIGGNLTIMGDGVANSSGASSRLLLENSLELDAGAEVIVIDGGAILPAPGFGAKIVVGTSAELTVGSTNGVASLIAPFPSGQPNSTIDIQIGSGSPSGPLTDGVLLAANGSDIDADAIFVGSDDGFGDGGLLEVNPLNMGDGAEVKTRVLRIGQESRAKVVNGGRVLIGSRLAIGLAIVDAIDHPDRYRNTVTLLNGGEFVWNGVIETNPGSPGFRNDANEGAFFAQSGGTIQTGASPGAATLIGDFGMEEGSRWIVEIAGTTADLEYDQLFIEGDAQIRGLIVFRFLDGFAPSQGQVFDFLNVTGQTDLSGATFKLQGLLPDFEYELRTTAAGIQMVALANGTSVPEPASALLLGLGLGGILLVAQRRLGALSTVAGAEIVAN